MKAIIIGAGLSGLTLALSLHEQGIESVIYEGNASAESTGLGINIQPNASRELIALGLGPELDRLAMQPSSLSFYNRHGQRIWHEPRGLAAGYESPQYSINRGRLQNLLLAEVRRRLGAHSVVAGHHLARFESTEAGVVAHFVDRGTGQPLASATGHVLIGADGIHSAVRRHFHPADTARFDNMIFYRGIVEVEPFLDDRSWVVIGHRDLRFVAYPLDREVSSRGRALVNWVANVRIPATAAQENWSAEADKAAFAPLFADWRYDWLDVPALIAATERVFQFPAYDRDPIDRWSFGRVTLVGDAAHPMLPIGGQAGSQAIVDARTLARELSGAVSAGSGIDTALLRYEAQRRDAMNKVTLLNRGLGPETVLQLAEERAPNGFKDIRDVLSEEELQQAANGFKQLTGLQVADVNAAPALARA